ncbi:MAG: isochorismatase family cysteine hydrolase [Brevundimonas sp.]|nr:isochorismatase family cysteine hydrolase [Brevundimonas sp.]
MANGLRDRVPENAVHLCVDMQRLFVDDTPWRTPWAQRVIPLIARVCDAHADRTCFTRFIPPAAPGAAAGEWVRYWNRWVELTGDRIDPALVELAPDLQRYVPPARVFDKTVYSPWACGGLQQSLVASGIDTLVVTGGETDICVLATVLGAVDLGFRVVVVTDALCSSADSVHDAALKLYRDRFGLQIETVELDELLDGWR